MSWLHLIILAAVQGITEFLPVSSSAHLILAPMLLGLADQGVMVDVAAHVGTLAAVIAYFYRDVGMMVAGGIDLLRGHASANRRLALFVILATIPALIAGGLVMALIGENFRSIIVIAGANLVFAGLLGWADKTGDKTRTMDSLDTKTVLWIGLSQALAFIPGTSRSGITMTTARYLGFTRVEAARFSMLISIPLIAAGGLYAAMDLGSMPSYDSLIDASLVALLSGLTAFAAIHFLMRLLQHISFMPFVFYRLALGAFLLFYAFV